MPCALVRSVLASSLVLLTASAYSADPNATVVKVGNRSVSVAELERQWLALPSFQRRALGDSNSSRLRAFVDRWVIPDLLLLNASESKVNRTDPRTQALEQGVLKQALVQRVREQTEQREPVTEEDVRAYFEAHRDLFDRSDRIRLFRILLADKKSAEELIQKMAGAPDFDAWRNLAREQSLDPATRMRGGELGFVSADGKSDIVELQVDPTLFEAAARLKDGELCKAPVPEGDKFAVLWRRGHTAATSANIASHRAAVREHLRHARAQAALTRLVQELRAKHVRDVRPEALEGITFEPAESGTAGAVTTSPAP